MISTKTGRSRLGLTWLALGLGALVLLAMPSLAAAKDRNRDRIPDRWEKHHNLSLNTNQAPRDQDHDSLRNRAEFLAGDDPRDRDSDDDGVVDGDEQAGTIASFDPQTGRLVIDLFGNDTIAGLVTDETEIQCDDDGSGAAASSEGETSDDDGQDSSGIDDVNDAGDDNADDDGSSSPGGNEESDDDADRLCTTAALVPGAVVEEAELKLANGNATFEEIELSGKEV